MYKFFKYNPKLKEYARKLRNNSTLGEVLLWKELRNKKLKGYDFHRQKPIHEFILDFFCPELMLGIEIDGFTHNYKIGYDINRQRYLENIGISILRFTEEEVRKNAEGVVAGIVGWIEEHTPRRHTPNPSQEGNRRRHTPNPSQEGNIA